MLYARIEQIGRITDRWGKDGVGNLERRRLAKVVPSRATESLAHGRPAQEDRMLSNERGQDAGAIGFGSSCARRRRMCHVFVLLLLCYVDARWQ